MNCYHCTAETSNGLALCDLCQLFTAECLEFLPIYFQNLGRWRPGRAGSRPVPGSRIPAGVFPATGDPVSLALDEVGADLDTWARCLTTDRGVVVPAADGEASVVRVLCWTFSSNLVTIATLDWAGEFVKALAVHETRLRLLTEKVAPGWYAGACTICETATHVVPGLTWVTCGGCGATTYARDHLEVILTEARGWVAQPKRLAEAVVALIDTELSVPRLHDRIRQWEQREKLIGLRRVDSEGDEVGPKRYRFGDVLDLVFTVGTNSGVDKAQAS